MINKLKNVQNNFKKSLESEIKTLHLARAYFRDFKRFNKSGFDMKDNNSYENLRSKITLYYHALEKGMSNTNLRLGFGKNAFEGLFDSMGLYKKLNYPLNDIRYITALSTIAQYIELHRSNNFDVAEVEEKFYRLKSSYSLANTESIGGFYQLNKEAVLKYKDSSFDILSKNRYSVRDFSEESVNIDLLEKAIEVATNTPSVCNRQAWKCYVVKNRDMIGNILLNQGGLNGFGKNLETLLVITGDNQYMGGYNERNQSFIDGGMFSMTLLYALENLGLAACTLNADLYRKNEIEIRRIVEIGYSEDIILFIAVGNYPDQFKVAKSHRDDFKIITEYRL